MDLSSSFMVPIARAFWGFVSLCVLCAGLGGALAGLALWYGGRMSGLLLVPWLVLCAFLVWRAEPIRKRYLKWVRVDPDGDG